MNQKTEVLAILYQLTLRYPNQTIPSETLDAYVTDLDGFPLPLVAEACGQIRLEDKFFPTVSRIVEKVLAIEQGMARGLPCLPSEGEMQQRTGQLARIVETFMPDLIAWPKWKGIREASGIPPSGKSLVGSFLALYHMIHELWPNEHPSILAEVRAFQEEEYRLGPERGRASYRRSIRALIELIDSDTTIPMEEFRGMLVGPALSAREERPRYAD